MSNLLKMMAVKFLARGFMCFRLELKETQQMRKMLYFFFCVGNCLGSLAVVTASLLTFSHAARCGNYWFLRKGK